MNKKLIEAVKWIAYNDNNSDLNVESIENNITVAMVADLFKKSEHQIAELVLKYRIEDQQNG